MSSVPWLGWSACCVLNVCYYIICSHNPAASSSRPKARVGFRHTFASSLHHLQHKRIFFDMNSTQQSTLYADYALFLDRLDAFKQKTLSDIAMFAAREDKDVDEVSYIRVY